MSDLLSLVRVSQQFACKLLRTLNACHSQASVAGLLALAREGKIVFVATQSAAVIAISGQAVLELPERVGSVVSGVKCVLLLLLLLSTVSSEMIQVH